MERNVLVRVDSAAGESMAWAKRAPLSNDSLWARPPVEDLAKQPLVGLRLSLDRAVVVVGEAGREAVAPKAH
jgi:hypothetical protein